MTTSTHDIGLGSTDGFHAALGQRPSIRHVVGVLGYETAADLRAYFDGTPTLFGELEDWMTDNLQGEVLARQDDMRAVFWVGLASDRDAVHFRLRWARHLCSA